MHTDAIVLNAPRRLSLQSDPLAFPGPSDVVVDIVWSGISTGTERLLYDGRMPPFPGLGYPLVPGYESVGRVRSAGETSGLAEGQMVFVPGANCYGEIRGLFGGAASRIVTAGARVVPVPEALGERATLLALGATAQHALALPGIGLPELIVGHGTLGRLLARLTVAAGGKPNVWEHCADRRSGGQGYDVCDPAHDSRRDYAVIVDASGDSSLLDTLIGRLAPCGAIVLAGFYSEPLGFAFPPAFMREARLLVAAQWKPNDMEDVARLATSGVLSLDGLVTHRASPQAPENAYRTAFSETACLKMILDWNSIA